VQSDFNYSHLRGGTGPLVYPGGFVWLYSALFKLTSEGQDIPLAQYIFGFFYIINLGIVLKIYSLAAPKYFKPVYLGVLCLSKRIHSIFTLRLFNDGPAMLLLYASILCLLQNRKITACILYSLAVSVKMNIFLFAPGLFLVLLAEGVGSCVFHIAICAIVQLVVGFPFLVSYPVEYLTQSFNIGRTFNHFWSVNFKWVPCEPLPEHEKSLLNDCAGIFTSKLFGIGLLVAIICFWITFAFNCGGPDSGGLTFLRKSVHGKPFSKQEIVTVMFVSNFIGVVLSKSLHFQFYIWYFHALLYILFLTKLPTVVKFTLLLCIEICWNPWPGEISSTITSSMILTMCHSLLLVSILSGLWVGQKKEHIE